jgi:outer membrane receptor protein involved in Fe transport
MRSFRFHVSVLALSLALGCYLTLAATVQPLLAQETTGGLQGTVKDTSGAVVPRAKVVLTGTTMLGSKELITDSSGYYHFANLPPGAYTMSVTAEGFKTFKQEGIVIQAGHLPTVDLTLQIGATATTVEVTSSGPVIDTTTTQNVTNVSSQTLQNAPTGTTFQSVIQYAPMARNEPLAGMSVNGQAATGGGGSMPGSGGNGLMYGFSIGGAADSESSYLVEGQDTENVSGGYSSANVPMDFIQEVQLTTSGVPAEYGGALGGVANVILKKGGNEFHGEVFSTYESSGTDANPVNTFLRYDPLSSGSVVNGVAFDPDSQLYSSQKEHFRNVEPGVLVGGPIVRDRLWFVGSFNPWYNAVGRNVNFGATPQGQTLPYATFGNQYFTQDRQTYYGYARLDAALTNKIRVFGGWLYQFGRETGQNLPTADPIASEESNYLNTAAVQNPVNFAHGIGSSAPNALFDAGADVTITQHLVATTRYGYFFSNYHDFGWPTSSPDFVWNTPGATDFNGNALPGALLAAAGTQTTAFNASYTLFDASKHYQFNQDFAFYKGGWWGTHNLKFGYQLNHLSNVIDQNGNVPEVFFNLGQGQSHSPFTTNGVNNCGAPPATVGGTGSGLEGEYYTPNKNYPASSTAPYLGFCTGQYGYAVVQDFATILTTPASDWNHALYAQDSWTIGKGVTLDVGLRVEKENLPAPGGVKVSSINFPWSDKIEPRLGGAWDPTGHGTMKIFGSYDVVNDVMKLLLAQTSWGAQAYEQCSYPMGPDSAGTFTLADADVVFKSGRACPTAAPNVGANFANGQTPSVFTDAATGIGLIENANFRPWEPVAPNVKPYRQHEYVVGWDYEITPRWNFEARYDRRRLDHVIEDASLSDTIWGEIYSVVNPGEGVDSTLDGYASFLASLGQAFGIQGAGYAFDNTADFGPAANFGTCPSCPPMPKAIRNYDGVEFRVTSTPNRTWTAMVSYTYSSLWGNYPGLTTTDQTDGGITGRNSPDTTRSFDEPFYYFGANGKSTDGPMPTDRPNVFKGLGTYTLPWWKGQATTIGLFQYFYQGSPMSSYIDLLGSTPGEPYEATYVFGRGNWVNMSTNPSTGAITLGTPYARRTPWYIQSDAQIKHDIKVGDHEDISFEGTATNALNQHAVTAYWQGMNSLFYATPLYPGVGSNGAPITLASGAALYQELESGYNVQTWINGNGGQVPAVVQHGNYGRPYLYQLGRQLRFGLRYTF